MLLSKVVPYLVIWLKSRKSEEDNADEDVPFLDDDISVQVLKTPKAKSTTKDSSPTNEDDVDANIASNVTTSDDTPYL